MALYGLNGHADISSGARGQSFGRCLHLKLNFMYASSECSGESAQARLSSEAAYHCISAKISCAAPYTSHVESTERTGRSLSKLHRTNRVEPSGRVSIAVKIQGLNTTEKRLQELTVIFVLLKAYILSIRDH